MSPFGYESYLWELPIFWMEAVWNFRRENQMGIRLKIKWELGLCEGWCVCVCVLGGFMRNDYQHNASIFPA